MSGDGALGDESAARRRRGRARRRARRVAERRRPELLRLARCLPRGRRRRCGTPAARSRSSRRMAQRPIAGATGAGELRRRPSVHRRDTAGRRAPAGRSRDAAARRTRSSLNGARSSSSRLARKPPASVSSSAMSARFVLCSVVERRRVDEARRVDDARARTRRAGTRPPAASRTRRTRRGTGGPCRRRPRRRRARTTPGCAADCTRVSARTNRARTARVPISAASVVIWSPASTVSAAMTNACRPARKSRNGAIGALERDGDACVRRRRSIVSMTFQARAAEEAAGLRAVAVRSAARCCTARRSAVSVAAGRLRVRASRKRGASWNAHVVAQLDDVRQFVRLLRHAQRRDPARSCRRVHLRSAGAG